MADQYLLVVNNQKGFSKFNLLKNSGDAINTDTESWGNVAGGISINEQLTEPDAVHTFTITVSEP